MASEPISPQHPANPVERDSQWRQRYDELQKRITRFSVVEQELINTRDLLDRERDRFGRIHSFNTRAIHTRGNSAFATIVAEAVVDIFELEFGALWLTDSDTQPTAITGLRLGDVTAGQLSAWLRQKLFASGYSRPKLLSPLELAEIHPFVPLRQMIVAACRDASGQVTGRIAGGITEAAASFHDQVNPALLGPFEVFTQQVSALIENRRDQAIIERQMRQIEMSEERLVLALEGSSAGLWDWNLLTGEIIFSSQWPALLGLTLAEMNNSPYEWHSRVHQDDLPSLMADFQNHVAGKTGQFENAHRMCHREGHYVWMLSRGRALRDKSGEAFRVVGTHLDITTQKELERRLRESEEAQRTAREQAEAANRAKSAFLATMSHEIRTPLNGVLGAVQLLRDLQLSGDQTQLVDAAEQSAAGLLEIIGDVLDLTKIEAGRLELESRALNLPSTLREVASSFSVRAKAKGLTLDTVLEEGLPISVLSDPIRLRQVLNNLIGNAIKFTSTGGITISASVKSRENARQWVEFSVRDTGIGIPADVQARLFTPFVQADSSTTRRFGGTGLGLAISRKLVELLGGEIRVVSEAGHGADFRFQLPFTTVDLPAAEPVSYQGNYRFSGRVLVAEDNPIGQKIAPVMLRKMGLTVDIASNGREAVQRFQENRYNVIFMDCHMPEMDGYEATLAIRRQESLIDPAVANRVWIIALTANALGGEREHCLSIGMDDHLTKPFKVGQLQAALLRAHHAGALPPPTQPSAASASEAADPEHCALDQLCAELDSEDVRAIVNDMIRDLPTRQAQFDLLLQQARFDDIKREAHSLKGLGNQFGLPQLARSARMIESAAECCDAEDLARLLAVFPREANEAARSLKSWMERCPGNANCRTS